MDGPKSIRNMSEISKVSELSGIVFIEILLIFDNLSYFGVFLEKKL